MDGWAGIDWAVVVATFVGPIAAVAVTLWHQGRSARQEAQRAVYSTMMRTRRHPTSADFVGAFNLVPVHFNRDPGVFEQYRKVLAVLNDGAWRQPGEAERLSQTLNIEHAHLLSRMSKVVGLPVEQLDILNGAYAPENWKDQEALQRALQFALFELLNGARSLPVALQETPPMPGADESPLVDLYKEPAKPG